MPSHLWHIALQYYYNRPEGANWSLALELTINVSYSNQCWGRSLGCIKRTGQTLCEVFFSRLVSSWQAVSGVGWGSGSAGMPGSFRTPGALPTSRARVFASSIPMRQLGGLCGAAPGPSSAFS